MTAADVADHQRRNFSAPRCTCKPVGAYHSPMCPVSLFAQVDTLPTKTIERIGDKLLTLSDRKTKPEREMGMILEGQKRHGEIVDYMFQGMSLAYAEDPETGILLRYKCDYVVIVGGGDPKKEMTGLLHNLPPATRIKIIECKGHGKYAISAAAKLRFKGAKAAWPMFKFEMHQRERDGQWRRVL